VSSSLRHTGAGTGGARAAFAPPTKLLGEQLVHLLPNFSVTYRLTDCKVTFNTKILENSPAAAYTFFDKYILHKGIM